MTNPHYFVERCISCYVNAILSCRLPSGVLRKNKYIFYSSKVERRTIHSDNYQEMGSKQKDHPLSINPGFKGNVTQEEDYHFFLPFVQKTFVDDYFSDLLLFKHRKIKFNNTVIGHHSILLGSRNYHIWSKCIISTLDAYSVLSF